MQVTEMERYHPSPGGNMTSQGMHAALQRAEGDILGGCHTYCLQASPRGAVGCLDHLPMTRCLWPSTGKLEAFSGFMYGLSLTLPMSFLVKTETLTSLPLLKLYSAETHQA